MAAALAHARLAVEDRATGLHPHGDAHHDHQRPTDQQQRTGGEQVEEPLAQPTRRGVVETARKHQPRRIHRVELHHAGFALEEAGQVDHRDALLHALQHLLHRKPAPPLIRRDHQFVDLQAVGEFMQALLAHTHQQVFAHPHGLAGHRHEPHHGEGAAVGTTAHAGIDQVGVASGAQDQHPLLQHVGMEQPHPGQPHHEDAARADRQRDRQHAAAQVGRRHQVVEHHQRNTAEGERQHQPQEEIRPRMADMRLVQAEGGHRARDRQRHEQGAPWRLLQEPDLVLRLGVETQPRRGHHGREQDHHFRQPQETDDPVLATLARCLHRSPPCCCGDPDSDPELAPSSPRHASTHTGGDDRHVPARLAYPTHISQRDLLPMPDTWPKKKPPRRAARCICAWAWRQGLTTPRR